MCQACYIHFVWRRGGAAEIQGGTRKFCNINMGGITKIFIRKLDGCKIFSLAWRRGVFFEGCEGMDPRLFFHWITFTTPPPSLHNDCRVNKVFHTRTAWSWCTSTSALYSLQVVAPIKGNLQFLPDQHIRIESSSDLFIPLHFICK